MAAERTRQQLDPSNTFGSRRGAIVLFTVAFGWSTGVVVIDSMPAAPSLLQVLGLVFLAAAGAVMVRSSDPLRAPLSGRSHLIVHLLLLAGFLAGVIAGWEEPPVFAEAWVPAAIGFFTVALSPYRPVRELVAAASLSALFIGFVSLVRTAGVDGPPPLAGIILSVLPILAFAFGAARYTQITIRSVERRQRQSARSHEGLSDELSHTIGRSVQRDRASVLDREAAPFLRDVLARDVVTETDRQRARSIAHAVRGMIVAEADLNWVETAASASPPARGGAHAVHDPDQLVSRMDQRQRAALRSLLRAASDPLVSSPLTLEFHREDDGCRGTVTFGVLQTTGVLQPALDPYLAVMTAAFSSFAVQTTRPTLIVRFSFDHN